MSWNENDLPQYEALEREMAQPDATDALIDNGPEPVGPLDQGQVDAGVRQQNESHAAMLRQSQEPRHSQPEPQGRQQQSAYDPEHHVQEDPIGFFRGHMGAMQQHMGEQQFWNGVKTSEEEARKELSDYDDAAEYLETARRQELSAMFPDNDPRMQAIARQHGVTPAHLRERMLDQDRIGVAQRAQQMGVSPAVLYYNVARQKGFQARPAMTTREVKRMEELAVHAPEQFDKAWDQLAKAQRL